MKQIFFVFIFLLPVSLSATTYTVTNTTDNVSSPSVGSLRWAINQANLTPGVIDNIVFNIPGAAPHQIQLQGSLVVAASSTIEMDGNTQPANGYTGVEPRIKIRGNANWFSMKIMPTVGCDIKNITFFQGRSLLILQQGKFHKIRNCVFFDADTCVTFHGSQENDFYGNVVGSDRSLSTTVSPSSNNSVVIMKYANELNGFNRIGGPGLEANVFVNMSIASRPLDVQNDRNKISRNLFLSCAKNIDLNTAGMICDGNICKSPPAFTVDFVGSTLTVTGSSSSSAPGDVIELFLTNAGGIDATQFLASVTTDGSGNWTYSTSSFPYGAWLIATGTDTLGNTSSFSTAQGGDMPCENCVNSFSPQEGSYLISAWVKESNANPSTMTYTHSKIVVSFVGSATTFDAVPSGRIIDGWQRIEKQIDIPAGVTDVKIDLTCTAPGYDVYYDDVRFFPLDGSMKSYVYDPVNLRLMAELDERNYATFYEYDEEGRLVRVKKETEKGVMTLKENRDNLIKKP